MHLIRFRGFTPTAACLLALEGCVTSPYMSPTSGPTATIQVASVHGADIGTRSATGACERQSFRADRGERHANLALIPASRPVWLGMGSTNGAWACTASFSFTPEPGGRYSAAFAITPIGDSRCVLSVTQRLPSGEEVRVKTRKTSWNNFCQGADQGP